MREATDFQRGLRAARVDARQGWVRCWLPARQLADDAVSGAGLSAEQWGYAAGLAEAFPNGVPGLEQLWDRVADVS